MSTGRSTPTPARVPTAESVPAAQRAVVWRAGTLTVPKPDRLIVRLVRTGTLVAATAVASATLLHAVSTWSVLPGVGPTPASRLWFAPVHTATEDRSPLGQGAADAFPVTFTPARTGAELPTTSTTPRLPPIHTAATSTDAGARSVGGPSDKLATQRLAVEQTEPAKPPARLPRDSDKRPEVVPAAKPSVAKPTTAKPSTPVAPRDSSKRPKVVPAAKPSVAKPTKAKASTPVLAAEAQQEAHGGADPSP